MRDARACFCLLIGAALSIALGLVVVILLRLRQARWERRNAEVQASSVCLVDLSIGLH